MVCANTRPTYPHFSPTPIRKRISKVSRRRGAASEIFGVTRICRRSAFRACGEDIHKIVRWPSFVGLQFPAEASLSGAGKSSVRHRHPMKTIWKILTGAAVLTAGGPAFAENQPLTCWYNDHADFTSADRAAASATVGAVTKYGSGDKTYNYTIMARDGTACPVQLPLSSLTAVTVALVRQEEGSCTNEDVVDNEFGCPRRLGDGRSRNRRVVHRWHTPCWTFPQHELPGLLEMPPPARNPSDR